MNDSDGEVALRHCVAGDSYQRDRTKSVPNLA